jgi:hypothetical protein
MFTPNTRPVVDGGLLVVDLILVRMGIRIFNREDILSKEMDEINIKNIWWSFAGFFLRPPEAATRLADHPSAKFNLLRFYLHDIPLLIKEYRSLWPFLVAVLGGLS